MGNALYTNWDDTRHMLYGIQNDSSVSVSIAFGTALTQFVVSEWILNSRNNIDRTAPSFIVSMLLFWAIWALIFNYKILTGTGGTVSGYYIATPIVALGGFALNLIFSLGWSAVRNRKKRSAGEIDDDANLSQTSGYISPLLVDETVATEPTTRDIETPVLDTAIKTQPVKKTVEYVNNIKIFLTNVVIIHHCAANFAYWPGLQNMTQEIGWGNYILYIFTMVNASYFMNLFFFYSGYFVPKSFDKKGMYSFLFDRTKRLGIPFVVYTFFLGPFVYSGFMKLFFQTPFPYQTNDTGPTWFLNQLLMFNIVYALACGKGWSPRIECPSLLGFFLISFTIGLLTGIILMFFPTSDFFFAVPLFWADYLSYPVYFFAGAIAQRNGWMESIKEKSRVAIYAWAILSIGLTWTFYMLFMQSAPAAVSALLQGVLHKGILSMGVSLAVSVFFMDYVNKSYRCTPFFSKAMYTAYIIQFAFPMLVGLKCLFLILDATGNVGYKDESNPSLANMYIVNSNLVFPGWLLVSTITLIIVWPMAYAIRSIPGFSQVL